MHEYRHAIRAFVTNSRTAGPRRCKLGLRSGPRSRVCSPERFSTGHVLGISTVAGDPLSYSLHHPLRMPRVVWQQHGREHTPIQACLAPRLLPYLNMG